MANVKNALSYTEAHYPPTASISGSTLMEAKQLGRVCYTRKFDEVYCDVIVKRWEKFTGKKAVKVEK